MKIDYHKNFSKQFEKLKKNEQIRVLDAIKLFVDNPFAEQLRNHQLKGKFSKFRSISAGGDIRLHYYEQEKDHIVVVL